MINLSVIIVLYNEFELVKKTLSSVYESKVDNLEVILVDNSSNNTGQKELLNKFPDVFYFKNKNRGFGAGVNTGVKKSKGEYILLLTPDMYLLPKTISKTLSFIEKNPEIGLVGSRIYAKPNSQEASILSRYPDLLTQLYYYNMPFYKLIIKLNKNYNPLYKSLKEHKKINYVIGVSGQYMLIRKKAFESINGFDERFFLYFEDIDLCKRLKDKNWQIAYLPFGGVVQNGLSNWKKNTRITQALIPYMESLYKFFAKHYGRNYAMAAWLVALISSSISIPFLVVVLIFKTITKSKSQSKELLPLWVQIVKWHFKPGLAQVLKA